MMQGAKLTNVAVVVLNYNNPRLTKAAVNHLLSFASGLQIIVVDNFSTDNSRAVLSNAFASMYDVHLVFNNTNLGYAHGNNTGIEYARELGNIDFIGIMNPDVIVDVEVIAKLVRALEQNTNIGLITTEVIYNGKYRVPNECAWRAPELSYFLMLGTTVGYFCRHILARLGIRVNIDGYYPPEHYRQKQIALVDVVQGCFFMGSLELLLAIDKLDEHTFLYFEENILAAKIKSLGKHNAVLVENRIQHNHQTKDERLRKKSHKLFDMLCLYQSRDYYIKEYTAYPWLLKSILRLLLKGDFWLRKAVVSLVFKD